jgi:hypothetical protein
LMQIPSRPSWLLLKLNVFKHQRVYMRES